MKDAKALRWDLKSLGLSETIIDAAWPEWWSEAAEPSPSAQSELRFSLSRKLGLEPTSLLQDQPKFIWKDEAKFKRLTTETSLERAAITSFGASVGRALLSATSGSKIGLERDPARYRELILAHHRFVDLQSLLSLCWGIGVPVISLRIFPLNAKRMTAMIVRVNERFAILLARDAQYPAPVAFYLAHELGHAALGHIGTDIAVVELGDALTDTTQDIEELEADQFALQLLTGMPSPQFLAKGSGFNAPAIARTALDISSDLKIEPGIIALCFGHSTGAWQQVFSSLRMIYSEPKPVWAVVNSVALSQLDFSALSDDTGGFLRSVMGEEVGNELRDRQ